VFSPVSMRVFALPAPSFTRCCVALQAGGRRFEPCTAHQTPPVSLQTRFLPRLGGAERFLPSERPGFSLFAVTTGADADVQELKTSGPQNRRLSIKAVNHKELAPLLRTLKS